MKAPFVSLVSKIWNFGQEVYLPKITTNGVKFPKKSCILHNMKKKINEMNSFQCVYNFGSPSLAKITQKLYFYLFAYFCYNKKVNEILLILVWDLELKVGNLGFTIWWAGSP